MTKQVVLPKMLLRLSPLEGLGRASLQQAVALANFESFPRGDHLPGFPWAQRVVYLLKGELKIDYPDDGMKVAVGKEGRMLVPLYLSGQNPVGAFAITDCDLLWFDERALDILMTWDQALRQDAANDGHADWRGGLFGTLDVQKLTGGIFAYLPTAHIESLQACFKHQLVSAGEVIVRQGERGDYYYVIERGRAQVVREVAGASMDLAQIQAGDAFGEEALIAGTNRNATVTMLTDGELLRLDGADFTRLLREPLLQSVDADEAARRVGAGSIWLDVRFSAEYRQDGLRGAINIPLNELRDSLSSLPKDQEYIVYCQTGRRSSAATFLMSQRGFRASLLEGGLKAMIKTDRVAA